MRSNHLGLAVLVGALLYVGASTYMVGTSLEEAEAAEPLVEAPIPYAGTRWVFLEGEPVTGLGCTVNGKHEEVCKVALMKDQMHPGKCYAYVICQPCTNPGFRPDWVPCP